MAKFKYPYNYLQPKDYRHIVAFSPGGCIQVDFMDLGKKVADLMNMVRYYLVGVDVYSRYMKVAVSHSYEGKGDITDLFIHLMGLFRAPDVKIDMVMADQEIARVEAIKEYCEDEGINLVGVAAGVFNTLGVVERAIGTLKELLMEYILKYKKPVDTDRYKNSVYIINSLLHYYNRKYHTGVGGIPIEIYAGMEGSKRDNINIVDYPRFNVGQKVMLRPRGRSKSEAFKRRKLSPGIVGEIKEIDGQVYTIETPAGKRINAKWYEFNPITDEEYAKFSEISLFY